MASDENNDITDKSNFINMLERDRTIAPGTPAEFVFGDNKDYYVVVVEISDTTMDDIRDGYGDSIEGVCDQVNDLIGLHDIKVRPLSEIISC